MFEYLHYAFLKKINFGEVLVIFFFLIEKYVFTKAGVYKNILTLGITLKIEIEIESRFSFQSNIHVDIPFK